MRSARNKRWGASAPLFFLLLAAPLSAEFHLLSPAGDIPARGLLNVSILPGSDQSVIDVTIDDEKREGTVFGGGKFSFPIDTTQLSDGPHVLKVRERNTAQVRTVQLMVDNSPAKYPTGTVRCLKNPVKCIWKWAFQSNPSKQKR